jgi:KDO2-lipid IV(A) lauroyltransferase
MGELPISSPAVPSLQDRIEYAGYLAVEAAARVLPTGVARALAVNGGRLAFYLTWRRSRWALVNARFAFPDAPPKELRRIVRESLGAMALDVMDVLRSTHWSEAELRERVTIDGLEHVQAALDRGRGAFLISAHLGNFELMIRRFGLAELPLLLLGRPLRNELLYAQITRSRTRFGKIELIDRKRSAMPMARALRANKLVGILMDQRVRRSQGILAPLFGLRCTTTSAVASIAPHSGAAVLCATGARLGPDRHRIEISPPLVFEQTGDDEQDIAAATAACNRALEERIRAHPEQWIWAHRRFRHSPDLEGDPYGREAPDWRARRRAGAGP